MHGLSEFTHVKLVTKLNRSCGHVYRWIALELGLLGQLYSDLYIVKALADLGEIELVEFAGVMHVYN